MRVRGLKPRSSIITAKVCRSHPTRVRGLKQDDGARKGSRIGYPSRRSHPARTLCRSAERKQDWVPVPPGSPGSHLRQECGKETRLGIRPAGVTRLAPHTGVRKGDKIGYPSRRGHPARTLGRSAERKQDWVPVPPGSPGSHLMQECGKETRLGIRPAGVTRLAPYAGVRKGDKIGYPSRRGHPARTLCRSAERRQDWVPVPPGSPGFCAVKKHQ